MIVRFGHLGAQNGRRKHLPNTDKSIYVFGECVCVSGSSFVVLGLKVVPLFVVFSQGICKRV